VAIAIRGTTPGTATSSVAAVSVSLTGARQPQAGDKLIIIHSNDWYTLADMPTPTVGGSTTGVNAITNGSFDGGSFEAHGKSYYYDVAATGDLTVAVTETSAGDEEKSLVVYVLSGAATGAPDTAGTSVNTTGGTTSETAPSISPTQTDSYLICHISDGNGANSAPYTPPGGMSETYDLTLGGAYGASGAVLQLSASGATGTKTFTSTGTAHWGGLSIAVRTAAAAGAVESPMISFRPGKTWRRRFKHLQRLALDQTVAAVLDADPTQAGYGLGWRWWRNSYAPQQRQIVSPPGLLDTALLENELLGSATTWEQYNRAATHVDRREVPQQRLLESPVGLLDTAELENELLGGATTAQRALVPASHRDRRLVPQPRLQLADQGSVVSTDTDPIQCGYGPEWKRGRRDPIPPQQRIPYESPYGMLDTAELENELLGGATTAQRTNLPASHVDRREVPQYTLRESAYGLLNDALLEVPPPLPWWYDEAAYLRVPWIRPKPVQADQSSAGMLPGPIGIRGGAPVTTITTSDPVSITLTGANQPQAGDLLIILHGNDYYQLTDMPTPTVGGSATGVTSIVDADGTNLFAHVRSYYYVVTAAGDLTVAVDETAPAGGENKCLAIYVLYGADTSNPIDASGSGTDTTNLVSTMVLPSVSPSSSDAYLICHLNNGNGAFTDHWTPPAGAYTEDYDAHDSGMGYTGGHEQLTSSGATGTRSFISLAGSNNPDARTWAGVIIAVRTAPGGAAPASIPYAFRAPQIGNYWQPTWLRQKQILFDQSTQASVTDLDPTQVGSLWADFVSVTHQRLPWLRLGPTKADQSSAANPFDPILSGYGWITELSPATHASRRVAPAQRMAISNPDDVTTVVVGTGATGAWWGVDDTSVYLWHALPQVSDPSMLVPAVYVDPTQGGYGPLWRWYRPPVAPVQRDRKSDPNLLSTALLEDPLGIGYGPRWMWYRPPVAPVQRERESDPRLLLTALLEDVLLGGWDDILRHRTWYVDRREVPQQRSYPDALLPPADPLLTNGAEWRYRLIPATHRARWVLRQWWQQQMSQAQPPLLFEGTTIGGVRGGPTILGGVNSGAGFIGGVLGGYLTGGVV